jgi:hypothetical protein
MNEQIKIDVPEGYIAVYDGDTVKIVPGVVEVPVRARVATQSWGYNYDWWSTGEWVPNGGNSRPTPSPTVRNIRRRATVNIVLEGPESLDDAAFEDALAAIDVALAAINENT